MGYPTIDDTQSYEWQLRELDSARDLQAITALFLDCADYILLVCGELPHENAGVKFFNDVAPGKSKSDMLKYGIFARDGNALGVVDIAKDYPEQKTWHIGLLLLHPKARRKSIGRDVVDEVGMIASHLDIKSFQLSVVEENVDAIEFWQALNFKEIRRTGPRRFGSKEHVCIEFSRALDKI